MVTKDWIKVGKYTYGFKQKNVLFDNLEKIISDKDDYLTKKKNMEKFSYQNTWNNINQKLISTIDEN